MIFKRFKNKTLDFFKPFITTKWGHWKDAFTSHIFILVGSLLPIWLTLIMLKLFSTKFSYTDLIDHGELAIYAAALITPALHIIIKDRQMKTFPYRTGLVIFSIIILITSVGFFSGVVVSAVKSDIGILDKKFLRYMTTSLWLFSIIISYLVSVLDCSLTTPDLNAIKGVEMKDLEQKFDETGKR